MSNVNYKRLVVQEIRKKANDFHMITFRHGHGIEYESGQFLTLVHQSPKEEIRRSYSITSAPILNEQLSIGVKRIPNGFFSRILIDRLRVGDELLSSGVGGFFRLPDNIQDFNKIIFFAAGSGITPIMSLLKTILHKHNHIKAYLIFSNHSPETAPFLEEIREFGILLPDNFFPELLFGVNPDLHRARLNRDLMLSLIAKFSPDRSSSLFYTCGPEAYMRMVIYILHELGFPGSIIRREEFVSPRIATPKVTPPNTGTHLLTLHLNGKQHVFPIHFPDTILMAAKKNGLTLPFSCETGKCGNCAAICLKGEVWLSNNEVLTDNELSKHITLTCVGHPVSDIELKIG